MEHDEKIIRRTQRYAGPIFSVETHAVRLEDGSEANRDVILHSGGVAVVAAVDGELLLVRQFRAGVQRVLLELPAGRLEPGEDPARCGLRELAEETGYAAQRLLPLGLCIPTPAYCAEVIHLYEAQELLPARQRLDPGEFLTVCRVPIAKAVEMALDGGICDAKTQVGILRYAQRHPLP